MHVRMVVWAVACLAAVVAPLAAQEAAPSPPRLSGMFTVYVLNRSGAETEGLLVSLTDSVIVVRTASAEQTFPLADVVRIQRKGDSLKTGAIIGAVFGGAAGLALVGDCSSDPSCGSKTRIAALLTGAGIWAAIGAGIDAVIAGRTVIWTPNTGTETGGLTVVLSPERRKAFVGWTIALGS